MPNNKPITEQTTETMTPIREALLRPEGRVSDISAASFAKVVEVGEDIFARPKGYISLRFALKIFMSPIPVGELPVGKTVFPPGSAVAYAAQYLL